jgi:hypothetical protein
MRPCGILFVGSSTPHPSQVCQPSILQHDTYHILMRGAGPFTGRQETSRRQSRNQGCSLQSLIKCVADLFLSKRTCGWLWVTNLNSRYINQNATHRYTTISWHSDHDASGSFFAQTTTYPWIADPCPKARSVRLDRADAIAVADPTLAEVSIFG